MKRKVLSIIIALCVLCGLTSCSKLDGNSSFSIQFIDVGQGDAALVECDGHYMLIDGGSKAAGDKVYNLLLEKEIQRLDILAISHLHEDHIGGLPRALTYATDIKHVISNSNQSNTETFEKLKKELAINKAEIRIPSIGEHYTLGSASVEVVDVSANDGNDSLVLMITYGETRFLFTGDIENAAQTRISDRYENETDEPFKVDLIKMPHHGAYTETLYRFLRTFMPEYIIISVGQGNPYGHPKQETLDILDSKTWKPAVYRTDLQGDIIVKSNGTEISVFPSRS